MQKKNGFVYVEAYELGNTVSSAVTKLKSLIESGRVVNVGGCGTVKNVEEIFLIIDCIEKKVLVHRLEKWRKSNEMGMKMGRPRGSVIDVYRDRIFALISNGYTLSETCDILGLKVSSVSKWMKRNGISLKEIKNIGGRK